MRFFIGLLFFAFASTAFAQKNAQRDSIKTIVDSIFPNGVQGETKSVCMSDFHGSNRQNSYYQQGNIAFSDDVIKITSDTGTIRWRDPKYKGGRYVLVLKDLFDEIVEYRVSSTNSCFIDFSKMSERMYILVVYSEDRRASYPASISIEKTK